MDADMAKVTFKGLVIDPVEIGPPGTSYSIKHPDVDGWCFVCSSPAEVQAFMRGLMIGEQGGKP